MTDPEVVARITRAFDAAYVRFAAADSFEEQEDETSNLLHHLYRLAVAVHGEPDKRSGILGWEVLVGLDDDRGLVPPLVLLRHKDVHEHVAQTVPTMAYSDVYTNLYGVLQWQLSPVMDEDSRTERYSARAKLDHTNVIDSLRAARFALAPVQ